MRLELVIDELVLVGFDPRERHRIADAFARSLETRARAADVLPRFRTGGVVPALRGADVTLSPGAGGASSAAVGDGVGGSVVKALSGNPRDESGGA